MVIPTGHRRFAKSCHSAFNAASSIFGLRQKVRAAAGLDGALQLIKLYLKIIEIGWRFFE